MRKEMAKFSSKGSSIVFLMDRLPNYPFCFKEVGVYRYRQNVFKAAVKWRFRRNQTTSRGRVPSNSEL
jgi:hypothetical protein